MGFILDCRDCDWAVDEPVELKGEANWIAGRHIAETGHSIALVRVGADADAPPPVAGVDVTTDRTPGAI